jgi:protein-disulfide isomerase
MKERWKTAVLGGLVGAGMSLLVVFAAIAAGIVPLASDARLHTYLMAHPKLAYEMQALSDAQDAEQTHREQQATIKKIGLKRFLDPAVAYVTGPANAKNTIIEFYDYNCGHCRNTASVVKAYYAKHKADTRFAFIEFPIFGSLSVAAAQASTAAHQQPDKFMAFHFELMDKGAADSTTVWTAAHTALLDVPKLTADMNSPNVEKAMLAGYRLAREMKFNGTPVFIVNGKVHEGEISEAEIKDLTRS